MAFLARTRPTGLASLSALRGALPSLASASHVPSVCAAGPSGSSGSVLPPFAFGAAIQLRNSTKRGGGSTKNNRNSAGKRLGVKRYGGECSCGPQRRG